MPAKRKPDPWRTRLTVPAADTSVQQWLDLQDDHSVSIRLLIRESIERNGYVDVMNRPVEQLPRRGRPPAADQGETGGADEGLERDLSEIEAVQAGVEESQRRLEGAQAQDPAPETEPETAERPEPGSGPEEKDQEFEDTQMDMDDIFGRGARK